MAVEVVLAWLLFPVQSSVQGVERDSLPVVLVTMVGQVVAIGLVVWVRLPLLDDKVRGVRLEVLPLG